MQEVWINLEDLVNSITDQYNQALANGHSEASAVVKAAAHLSINREQMSHPRICAEMVGLLLNKTQ